MAGGRRHDEPEEPGNGISTESDSTPGAAGALRRRRLLSLELLPTALLAALIAWGLWGFSYDDAFISYRYAESFARGDGLTFNPGETVLGTTAPGWAAALGGLAWASAAVGVGTLGPGGSAVPGWGTLLTVAALWWLAAALPALWLPAASPLRPALPLLLGTLALTCRWNLELLGAETFPAAALAATSAWLALGRDAPPSSPSSGREIAAGLAAAAAMLCRLDAALAAAAVGLVLWWRDRRLPWRYAVAGLAPLVPYLVWLEIRFGSVIPNTLAGKRGEAALASLGYGASEWWWLGRAFGDTGRWALVAGAAIGAALAIGRLDAARRRAGRLTAGSASGIAALIALALWLLLHESFYRAAGVVFAPWYHVAALGALLALAAGAAVALGNGIALRARRLLPAPAARRLAGALLALLVALPMLRPGTAFLAATWGEPPDPRTRLYAAVGRHLRERAPAGSAVASMEIGALAYHADRPVLDLVGLVDPEVLAARDAGRLPELVAERAPDYILVPPPFLGRELGGVMRHTRIRDRYRPAARFFDPAYEHDPVTLYRRAGPAR